MEGYTDAKGVFHPFNNHSKNIHSLSINPDSTVVIQEPLPKKSLQLEKSFTMEDYDSNETLQNGGEIRNALALAKKYGTKSEIADMESMLRSYESTGNTYDFEYDAMIRIDSKYYSKFDADEKKSDRGTNFTHGGRTYHVNLDEKNQTISIDERYQDENNIWHTKKGGFFAQGEDAETIAKDSGGWYVNTIVDYVDSSGALQELNKSEKMSFDQFYHERAGMNDNPNEINKLHKEWLEKYS